MRRFLFVNNNATVKGINQKNTIFYEIVALFTIKAQAPFRRLFDSSTKHSKSLVQPTKKITHPEDPIGVIFNDGLIRSGHRLTCRTLSEQKQKEREWLLPRRPGLQTWHDFTPLLGWTGI